MGGEAVFLGTKYQAAVIAGVYIRILAHEELGWLGRLIPDVPVAVEAETDGPGDDLAVEFEPGCPISRVEAQAKHSMDAGAELRKVLGRIKSHEESAPASAIVLVLGDGSSRVIRQDFRGDLERLRDGRQDHLHLVTRDILKDPSAADILKRLHIVVADYDQPHDGERQAALTALRSVLQHPDTDALSAWDHLVADATDLCAARGRRTAEPLKQLLKSRGIALRPSAPDEGFSQSLAMARALRQRGNARAALPVAQMVLDEADVSEVSPSLVVKAELEMAEALLQLDDNQSALDHAQRALMLEPEHGEALGVAALAAIEVGRVDDAREWARRACDDSEGEIAGFCALLRIDVLDGSEPRSVPRRVAESVPYRSMQAAFALERGDAQECLRITKDLIPEGQTKPGILMVRCQALQKVAENGGVGARGAWEEIERLADDVLRRADPAYRFRGQALIMRGRARKNLGRPMEGDRDLLDAEGLDPANPAVIQDLVAARMESGDLDGALRVLRPLSVDQSSLLLSWRSSILVRMGKGGEARQDIEKALALAAGRAESDEIRLRAIESFVMLGDAEAAARSFAMLSSEARTGSKGLMAEARISLLNGDVQAAIASYRSAAELDPMPHEVLSELAVNLTKKAHYAEAIAVFVEIGITDDDERRHYVEALLKTGDLATAKKIVDETLAGDALSPAWALLAATQIAQLQEDATAAIDTLAKLIDRNEVKPTARIALASMLLDEDQTDAAARQVELLEQIKDLSPVELMRVSVLLHRLGRVGDAVQIGYRAHRAAPNDPEIQQAFAGMFFTSDLPELVAEEVQGETYVEIETAPDTIVAYTVLSSDPINPSLGEISLSAAENLGLVGKRVGDVVPALAVETTETAPVIRKILPAIVYKANEIVINYRTHFPDRPAVFRSIPVNPTSGIKEYVPLTRMVHDRASWTEQAMTVFRDRRLALGFLAVALHESIADVMDQVMANYDRFGFVRVEDPRPIDFENSRVAAVSATEVVLTRSGLHTLQILGLLDAFANAGYALVAPKSLVMEIHDEEAQAKQISRRGWASLGEGPAGFVYQEIPAGDELLNRRQERILALRQWVQQHVRIEPRPLSAIGLPGSAIENARDKLLGHGSFDAVALASEPGRTLYADDMGLRGYALGDTRPSSFSTLALLQVFVDKDLMSAQQRDESLARLVLAGYGVVLPAIGWLEEAVCHVPAYSRSDLTKLFVPLCNPALSDNEATTLAVGILKKVASRRIAPLIGLDIVTSLAVQGMAAGGRRQVAHCARLVAERAHVEFFLLPQAEEAVLRACAVLSQSEPQRPA